MEPPTLPQDHPEQAPDEYFMGNANETMLGLQRFNSWKTLRRGTSALDRNGNPFEKPGWFPVFVKKDEWENTGSRLFK